MKNFFFSSISFSRITFGLLIHFVTPGFSAELPDQLCSFESGRLIVDLKITNLPASYSGMYGGNGRPHFNITLSGSDGTESQTNRVQPPVVLDLGLHSSGDYQLEVSSDQVKIGEMELVVGCTTLESRVNFVIDYSNMIPTEEFDVQREEWEDIIKAALDGFLENIAGTDPEGFERPNMPASETIPSSYPEGMIDEELVSLLSIPVSNEAPTTPPAPNLIPITILFVSPSGAPIPNVNVEMTRYTGLEVNRYQMLAGADGTLTENIFSGFYTGKATAPGFYDLEESFFHIGPQSLTVVLTPKTVQTVGSSLVTVKVKDSVTLLPISGALVQLGLYNKLTDAAGIAQGIVPHGSYLGSVTSRGYASAPLELVHVGTVERTVKLNGAVSHPRPAPETLLLHTILIKKIGGKGEIFGSYGNPICPSYDPNNCFTVNESGRNIAFTVVPLPGYKFMGWGGDSECTLMGENHVLLSKDLSCIANFALGTAPPSACLAPGTRCEQYGTCQECCDFNPNNPYRREHEFGEYNYYCIGEAVSGQSASVLVSSANLYKGQSVIVSWLNLNVPTTTDWVGLYQIGSANNQFKDYVYTSSCSKVEGVIARTTGSCTFKNLQPGNYEIRMFQKNHFTPLGKSIPIFVQSTTAPAANTVIYSGPVSGTMILTAANPNLVLKVPGIYRINVGSQKKVRIRGVAAGGGGASSWSGDFSGGGGGGGGASNAAGVVTTLQAKKSYEVIVGQGGAGGQNTSGTRGGNTIFRVVNGATLLSLNGGGGGSLNGGSGGSGGTVVVGVGGVAGGQGGFGGKGIISENPNLGFICEVAAGAGGAFSKGAGGGGGGGGGSQPTTVNGCPGAPGGNPHGPGWSAGAAGSNDGSSAVGGYGGNGGSVVILTGVSGGGGGCGSKGTPYSSNSGCSGSPGAVTISYEP